LKPGMPADAHLELAMASAGVHATETAPAKQ